LDVLLNNKELEKLYTTGKSKKLKLPEPVIEKFLATIQKIDSAISIYDLWKDSALKFEKLKGTDNGYSLRLTGKYRLEMKIEWKDESNTIGKFYLEEISNHYGD